jgi:hypothetical protein
MTGGLGERWRRRGGRTVRIALVFDDIIEFALALLSVPPDELEALGWSLPTASGSSIISCPPAKQPSACPGMRWGKA